MAVNKIRVKITNIAKSGSVALVKLDSLESSAELTALVLDFCGDNVVQNFAPNQAQNPTQNLKIGTECNAIFKESEVMIALLNSRVSARNCFEARIANIECDEIFARIYLDFESLTALITKEACDALNLKIGKEILWFVKSNEVALEFGTQNTRRI